MYLPDFDTNLKDKQQTRFSKVIWFLSCFLIKSVWDIYIEYACHRILVQLEMFVIWKLQHVPRLNWSNHFSLNIVGIT